jgi:hypothetical protein
MKVFDFLSLSPSLYSLKQDRGKNKLGGFFSIIFLLLMISLTIYYVYIYLSGSDYNLTYYRDNRSAIFKTQEQKNSIYHKQFYFSITNNTNNAKITPLIMSTKKNKTNIEPAPKCKYNPSTEYFKNDDDIYCFDLIHDSLITRKIDGNHFLYLTCEENCTDKNGEPARIDFLIVSDQLIMDHSNVNNPIQNTKNIEGYEVSLKIDYNNTQNDIKFTYIPRVYNTTKIFSTKIESFIYSYVNDLEVDYTYDSFDGFGRFSFHLSADCDVYIREYISLLDTISTIGGLFSPFQLLFQVLVIFYSELEINSEITKNVFSKIKYYEYKRINKISIDNNNINNNIDNINFEISKEEKEKLELRKKFNIIKSEQYFCSFFNFCCDCCHFCKTHRTLKILNLCSDFVRTYLSAENIIFNMILFENYYNDNPIKYMNNSYLNKIDKEIENKEKNNLEIPLNTLE